MVGDDNNLLALTKDIQRAAFRSGTVLACNGGGKDAKILVCQYWCTCRSSGKVNKENSYRKSSLHNDNKNS
jgi:hypothetical protein